jgi:protein-disulfide isomerase
MKKSFLAFLLLIACQEKPKAEPQKAVPVSAVQWQERSVGKVDAPITILEYASLTCGHCAHFHKDVLPMLEKEFIANGKVRYTYRDFPLDGLALQAAALTRCANEANFFPLLKEFYSKQQQWLNANGESGTLKEIAAKFGVQGDACLANKALQEKIVSLQNEASQQLKVDSTPTVFINNQRYTGDLTADAVRAYLQKIK